MDHLVADLNHVVGSIRALKVEQTSGTLHPLAASPVLRTVQDGYSFSLVREKDFLERNRNPAARKLRLSECPVAALA